MALTLSTIMGAANSAADDNSRRNAAITDARDAVNNVPLDLTDLDSLKASVARMVETAARRDVWTDMNGDEHVLTVPFTRLDMEHRAAFVVGTADDTAAALAWVNSDAAFDRDDARTAAEGRSWTALVRAARVALGRTAPQRATKAKSDADNARKRAAFAIGGIPA